MAKSRIERIASKMDEYIVNNQICINDEDEEDYGQCVATFYLSDVLEDSPQLKAALPKLSLAEITDLICLFNQREIMYGRKKDNYYGTVFTIHMTVRYYDLEVEIWDGC